MKFSVILLTFIIVALLVNLAIAVPPQWSVENPGQYGLQENVTALLYLNDAQVEGADNIVAAFVGETVRGVASPAQIGSDWLYFMTIYANTEGETVTFRAYVAAEDDTLDVVETTVFVAGQLGSFDNPFEWHTYLNFDRAPIVSGIPDQTVETGNSFATFDLDDYLTELDGDAINWSYSGNANLNVVTDGQNVVAITPVNPTWTGSENIIFTATDVTPNQYADSDTATFTILPEDHPPDVGVIPDQTIAPGASFTPFDLDNYLTELDGDSINWSYEFQNSPQGNSAPSWSVNPNDYAYSMQITARLVAYGDTAVGADHILGAFVGEELRGSVSAVDGGSLGWLFPLTVYSNTENEVLEFQFFDANAEDILPVKETAVFVGGSVLGTVSDPIILNAGNLVVEIDSDNVATISILDETWLGTQSIKFIARDVGTLNEYSDFSWADFTVQDENMTFQSCTTFHPDTSLVFRNSQNQVIMGIKIFVTGNISPLSVTQINCNTFPSDNPITDILNASLYYTGLIDTFSTDTLSGTTPSPNGEFSLSLDQQLFAGENYFWIAYDVPAAASGGNILDCECQSLIISGQMKTPTLVSPQGNRTIGNLQNTDIAGILGNGQTQFFSVDSEEICRVVWNSGFGVLPNHLDVYVAPNCRYPGINNSILRYWRFDEAGGVWGWSGRIRFYYNEAELNGIDETQLTLWKTQDGGQNWLQLPIDIINPEENWVEAIVSSFSDFTFTDGDQPLPVLLSKFYGEVVPDGILLHWQTMSEFNNAGFYVYRDGEKISKLIPGYGTTNESHTYRYLDEEVVNGQFYRYQLSDIEKNTGNETFHPEITIVSGQGMVNNQDVPKRYALYAAYPNPFNPTTTIKLDLPEAIHLNLAIYDVTGKLIRTFADNEMWKSGSYSIIWNGEDDNGIRVSSGTYFFRMNTKKYNEVKQVVLLK